MQSAWPFLPVLIFVALMLATSVTYFSCDRSGSSIRRRLATSAHGVVGAALLLGAAAFSVPSAKPNDPMAIFFLLFHLVPMATIVASFIWYRGPKHIHFLQILNVPLTLWSSFVAYYAVFG